MSRIMEIKRNELLTDIECQVATLCKNYKLDEDICEQISVNVANFIAEHYAGQVISFPKDYYYKIAQRDLDMYSDFTGNNWHQLVRKYNLTEIGVRKAILRVQKRLVKQKQPDLFN